MSPFEHTVCQLMIGCESRPSPEAQSIACSIVESYMLKGYTVTSGITHKANEQTTVDFDEEL